MEFNVIMQQMTAFGFMGGSMGGLVLAPEQAPTMGFHVLESQDGGTHF